MSATPVHMNDKTSPLIRTPTVRTASVNRLRLLDQSEPMKNCNKRRRSSNASGLHMRKKEQSSLNRNSFVSVTRITLILLKRMTSRNVYRAPFHLLHQASRLQLTSESMLLAKERNNLLCGSETAERT